MLWSPGSSGSSGSVSSTQSSFPTSTSSLTFFNVFNVCLLRSSQSLSFFSILVALPFLLLINTHTKHLDQYVRKLVAGLDLSKVIVLVILLGMVL